MMRRTTSVPSTQAVDSGIYAQRFRYPSYTIQTKGEAGVAGVITVHGPDGRMLLYSRQRDTRRVSELCLYSDEYMQDELLLITAVASHDGKDEFAVVDLTVDETVGMLRPLPGGAATLDIWRFLTAEGEEIGGLRSIAGMPSALGKIFGSKASKLLPASYQGVVDGVHVCSFRRGLKPLGSSLELDFTPDIHRLLDRRLGIAAGVMVTTFNGR